MPAKNNLRDKLEDDVLDLSLMQLTDVPVNEIALLPKGTTVDLSNNLLELLPENFPTLTHIVKLDLGKNQLRELPEYFGQLKNLRHLDLYSNQLDRLPVSFSQLKNLKWLDLKNNPLVPALQQAAGPCITASDCAMCAKKVVALLQSMQSQLERERQRRVMEEQRALQMKREQEEQERERLRAEKRAAKERRREEARAKEEQKKKNDEMNGTKHEMERPRNGVKEAGDAGQQGQKEAKGSSGGFCWSLFVILLTMLFITVGTSFAVIWVYTGGNLDHRSIERALPVIRRDVDSSLLVIGKKTVETLEAANKAASPYLKTAQEKFSWLWDEWTRRTKVTAQFFNENFGPWTCHLIKTLKRYWTRTLGWVDQAWTYVKPSLESAWQAARPHFQALGAFVIEKTNVAVEFLRENGPVVLNIVYEKCLVVYEAVAGAVNGLVKGQ